MSFISVLHITYIHTLHKCIHRIALHGTTFSAKICHILTHTPHHITLLNITLHHIANIHETLTYRRAHTLHHYSLHCITLHAYTKYIHSHVGTHMHYITPHWITVVHITFHYITYVHQIRKHEHTHIHFRILQYIRTFTRTSIHFIHTRIQTYCSTLSQVTPHHITTHYIVDMHTDIITWQSSDTYIQSYCS